MGDLCVVQRRLKGRFWKNHLPRLLTLFLFLPLFSSPLIAEAIDDDLEQDLQKSLTRSKTLVAQIKTRTTRGASVTSELTQLKAAAENIKISNLLLEERFKLRAEKVKTLGAKAVERHEAMVGGYRQALIDYLTLIDNLPSGGTISQSAIRNLLSLLEKILPKRTRPIIGSLPYKHLNYPAVEPISVPEIIPAYKGGNKTVSPDDTAATAEAPISNEIATLAQSLNWSPVSIYEYVKNNIETEWYRGCQKGAEETLHQKSGNDCDQAALLTALLRASGFPTRYVRGVILFFPGIERAKNLTGIDDPMKIAEFFQKAGIPCTPVIAGGTISNFQIEHVWVESQIPYSNYRGAIIDDRGKTWLGLDTSIKVKGYTYNSNQDILSSMSFSTIRDEYLGLSSQPTNTQAPTPLEFLQYSINSELQAQNSQLAYADFLRTRVLVPEVLNILPASLQFMLVKATNEYTAIPDELIHQVKFTTTDPSKNELFTITLPSYKLSNRQIAISYEPETILTFGSAGWDYRWVSGNIVIDIEYHDTMMSKPEPLEIVSAYLAKYPSTLAATTSGGIRSTESKTTWIKDEMDRRLWLCDKWFMQLQLQKAQQGQVLQESIKSMNIFLDYREKYYGIKAADEKNLLSGYLNTNNGTGIKAKLTEYKNWWAVNKDKAISL